MLLNKKELLWKMIEEDNIKQFTIIGKPTQELKKAYYSSENQMMDFLEAVGVLNDYDTEDQESEIISIILYACDDKNKIEYDCVYETIHEDDYEFDDSFDVEAAVQYDNYVCSITVSRKVTLEEYNMLISLFTEVIEYYQTLIPAYIMDKLFSKDESILNFQDMLLLMGERQTYVASVLNKSRQLITDMKSGKSNITLETVSVLMNKYPLLPWNEFIRQYN